MQSKPIATHLFSELLRVVGEMLDLAPDEVRGNEIQRAIGIAGRDRANPHTELLLQYADAYLREALNSSHDSQENGEVQLCHALEKHGLSVVFDVGANVGNWTKAVKQYHPAVTVHGFEIVPSTFAELEQQLSGFTDVVLNNVGLGHRNEETRVFSYPDNSELSSRFSFLHKTSCEPIMCTTIRGDDYLSQNKIGHIDFLKIDVEGSEPEVLKGFNQAFENQSISLVQFEYGQMNILRRFLLIDFYQFFETLGYAVGKLFPEGVRFKEFALSDENFYNSNFIACSKSKPDLIEFLRNF